MFYFRMLTAATLAALLCTPSWAQNLTKAEEGRALLGQCYSACTLQAEAGTAREIALVAQLWESWRDANNYGWSQETFDAFLDGWKGAACQVTQNSVIAASACREGCVDIERVYGTSTSLARSTFNYTFNEFIDELKQSGLWLTNVRDAPKQGTAAFEEACDRFLSSESESTSTSTNQVRKAFNVSKRKGSNERLSE